ncbi:caspase-7-like [Mytilus trossulus]|uniref:caspase-7-like n=1 Tax=Mytilus trossulus TaxID=6551 RepID=UPI003005708A
MRGIATKIAQDSIHEDSDCFVCVVASHGREKQTKTDTHGPFLEREQEILGVDGNEIRTSDFVAIFSDDKCKGLRGKPKFFFIQACRTAEVLKMDEGCPLRPLESLKLSQETHGNKFTNSAEEVPMVTMVSCPEDTLIMFASVSGNLAMRNPMYGSWMLQELYNCLDKNRKDLGKRNFLEILTHVLARLSKKETSAKQFFKQFSPGCFIHCLTKDVFMKEKVPEC